MTCLGREHDELTERGFRVLGISADDVSRHRRFAAALELPFDLLSDPDLAIAKRYGVAVERGDVAYARRSVFLIDRLGVLRYADREFGVPGTLAESGLLAAADEIVAADPLPDLPRTERTDTDPRVPLAALVAAVLAEDTAMLDVLLAGVPEAQRASARKRLTMRMEDRDLTSLSWADAVDMSRLRRFDHTTDLSNKKFAEWVGRLLQKIDEEHVVVVAPGGTSEENAAVFPGGLALLLRRGADDEYVIQDMSEPRE